MKINATRINSLYKNINEKVEASQKDSDFYNSKKFVSNSDTKEMLANVNSLVSSFTEANRNGFDKVKLLNSTDKKFFQTEQGYLFATRSNKEMPLYCFIGRNENISEMNEERGLATFECSVNKLEVAITFVFKNESTFNSIELETNTKLVTLNDGDLAYDSISESMKQELIIGDQRLSKIKVTVNAKKGFNYVSLFALYHNLVRSTEVSFDLPETDKFHIELDKSSSLLVSLYLKDDLGKTLIGTDYQSPIELLVNPVNNVFELPMPISSMELYEEGVLLQETTDYSFKVNTTTYATADALPELRESDSLTVVLNSSNPTKTYYCYFVARGNSWKGIGYKNKTTSVSTKGKKLLLDITNLGVGFEDTAYFKKPVIWYKS